MRPEQTRRRGQNQQLPGHHLSKPALLLRIIILQMLRRERGHPMDVWLLLLLQNQSALSLRPEPLKRNTGILQGVEKWEKGRQVVLFLIISFPLQLSIYLFTYLFICCTHVRVGVCVIGCTRTGTYPGSAPALPCASQGTMPLYSPSHLAGPPSSSQ